MPDGKWIVSSVFRVVTVLYVATALKPIQKAKLCQLYHPNLCPLLLIQLTGSSAIAIAPTPYLSYHGNFHPHLRPCRASTGNATLIQPPSTPTLTATPCQPQTDSARGMSVTSSTIPASAQALTSPTSHSPQALTEKCSLAPLHHLLAAHVRTVPADESINRPQSGRYICCTLTNQRIPIGPKQLGYNGQERHFHYGKQKIHGSWQERQNSGSAKHQYQHFVSATLLWTMFQTRSNLDLSLHLTRAMPSPSH